MRLSRDVEGEGHYVSALASFRSRTAYANSGGDHLVGSRCLPCHNPALVCWMASDVRAGVFFAAALPASSPAATMLCA